MHAMSHRSDFFASSSRVNIQCPAICCTITLLSAVTRVVSSSFLIPTAVSDSQSLNTSILEVVISSTNERVFIRYFSDLTSQVVFNAWTASNNGDLKRTIAWSKSRHLLWWPIYLHCGIDKTSSPGIIGIVCHQVLCHPSEHGTSSMLKHLLTKALIAMVKEETDSELTKVTSSMVDETALAILKRQWGPGIAIVCSQRVCFFDIQVHPYWPNWETERSKLAANDFETSEYHQDTWNRYLMLGVSADIPWNAISNVELRRSYRALSDDLLPASATTFVNVCLRQYVPTVDAITKQLASQNSVTLSLDGCISTNKLAKTSVITDYMNAYWALREVQLTFDEVDRPFFCTFDS